MDLNNVMKFVDVVVVFALKVQYYDACRESGLETRKQSVMLRVRSIYWLYKSNVIALGPRG